MNEYFINGFLDELEKHSAYPIGTGWMKPGVQKIKPYAQRAFGAIKRGLGIKPPAARGTFRGVYGGSTGQLKTGF